LAADTRPPGCMSCTGRPGSSTTTRAAKVVRGDEHRRDDEVLARRQGAEVDERSLQRVRGTQRAVVRLIARARAVGVREERSVCVERVRVRVVERGRQRKRGRSKLVAPAMDAALERAEADSSALELEAIAQPREGNQVLIHLREQSSPRHRRLSQRQVGVDRRHPATVPQARRRRNRFRSAPEVAGRVLVDRGEQRRNIRLGQASAAADARGEERALEDGRGTLSQARRGRPVGAVQIARRAAT
jgi:hypothetical protein